MKTDLPLKRLFQERAADLLVLTGDEGATVEDVAPIELSSAALRVDTVMRLSRAGETWFRHVEFQACHEPGIETRLFEYNVQLTLTLEAPVLTTVLWVQPPGPRGEPMFRVALGGREVHAWRYESVCLWTLPVEQALRGGPGLAALAPLLEGGGERDVIVRAARRIDESAPERDKRDLLAVLSALTGRRYTVHEILDLVGREAMIESNFMDEIMRRGREQGGVEEDRRLCLEVLREYHPDLRRKLKARIQMSTDAASLRTWILRAPRLSDAEFARLVLGRAR